MTDQQTFGCRTRWCTRCGAKEHAPGTVFPMLVVTSALGITFPLFITECIGFTQEPFDPPFPALRRPDGSLIPEAHPDEYWATRQLKRAGAG
jgi:hypothetical protein